MQPIFSDTEVLKQLNLLPLGFVIVLDDSSIIYSNETAVNLLDGISENIVGKNLADYIHEDCKKHYFDELLLAKKTKVSWPLQLKLNLNERKRYIEIFVTRFFYDDQEVFQIVISDVTLKKNIETEMKKLLAQAFRSNKLATIGELVAGVAHEVNNPLSIIQTYLEIIRDHINSEPKPDPLSIKALDKQEAAVKRITEIVRGLRTYARGSDVEDISDVDVHNAINSTISLISFIYKKQNILFDIKLEAAHSTVKANMGKLQQVFMNLFSNARDAILEKADSNGGKINVTTSNQTENALTIMVSDDGMGIPQANLDKIFHSFFTTKDEEKGTGLGLSITYSLVNNFKGSIKVESTVGSGTTFLIVFPLFT